MNKQLDLFHTQKEIINLRSIQRTIKILNKVKEKQNWWTDNDEKELQDHKEKLQQLRDKVK